MPYIISSDVIFLFPGYTLDPLTVSQSPEIWDSLQTSRRNRVTQVCQNLNNHDSIRSASYTWKTLNNNDNVIVDPKHHVFYCAIPKVACASWRAALALLSGKLPDHKPATMHKIHNPEFLQTLGLHSPADLSPSQLNKILQHFTKFLIVRHPLERLVSAYRDKFRTFNKWTRHFQLKYGRKIAMLYRQNVTTESLMNGHDVTFPEFLSFITDTSVPTRHRMNPHWETYQNLCHPCLLQYNHIVKFETMALDNDVILNRYFHLGDNTDFFPKRNIKSVPSSEIMVQYYSTVPADLVRRVYEYYKVDMDMFGYHMPNDIL